MSRGPRLMRFRLGAAVLAAAVTVSSCSGSSSSAVPVVGKVAPSWSGTSLQGARVSSRAEAGRWLVLNFFATWCPPCQRETPQLVRFAAEHAARGDARVVGVLYLDSAGKARRFVIQHGVTWPLVDDSSGTIAARYEVTALPQSFVIDPAGHLVAREFGGVTDGELDALMATAP